MKLKSNKQLQNQHDTKNTIIARKAVLFIVWKHNKKQTTKSKHKFLKQQQQENKTNIKTERQKHTPWKQNKNKRRKKCPKQKQLGFQKEDVRKFVSKKEANIKKGNTTKKKNKPPQRIFSKKGLMDKKRKWNFEREDKRKTRKDNRKEENKHFKTGLLWEQNRQKTLKLQENNLFWGIFYKTKVQKHRQQKTKPPTKTKNWRQKHLLHFGEQAPNFCTFFQVTLHPFMSAGLCLLKTL